jgi:hypothetical protein
MRLPRKVRPLTIDQLVDRVRREFAALPGLQLTEAQACRLWDLDPAASRGVLRRLVDARYLEVDEIGHYVRADAALQRQVASLRRRHS